MTLCLCCHTGLMPTMLVLVSSQVVHFAGLLRWSSVFTFSLLLFGHLWGPYHTDAYYPSSFSIVLSICVLLTHRHTHLSLFFVLSCHHLPCLQCWMRLLADWLAGSTLVFRSTGRRGVSRGKCVCECTQQGGLDQRLKAWNSIELWVVIVSYKPHSPININLGDTMPQVQNKSDVW